MRAASSKSLTPQTRRPLRVAPDRNSRCRCRRRTARSARVLQIRRERLDTSWPSGRRLRRKTKGSSFIFIVFSVEIFLDDLAFRRSQRSNAVVVETERGSIAPLLMSGESRPEFLKRAMTRRACKNACSEPPCRAPDVQLQKRVG